jgi:hypothetical protein
MLLSNLQNYGYLAVALFIALECIGFPLPGETTLITASVYAGSTHRLNIGVILAVAAAAAIAGDNLGYLVGRRGRGLVHNLTTLIGIGVAGLLGIVGFFVSRRRFSTWEQRARAFEEAERAAAHSQPETALQPV